MVAGQNNQHIVSHEHLPPELHLENQNPFTNELNHPHETDNDYSKYQPFLHDLDQKLSDSNSETKYFNDYDISYQPSDLLRENENHDDFTVIQILEKERHAWHIERVKLIQCIYLQQMELAQRANASQNRASEIAKVCILLLCFYMVITIYLYLSV